MRTQLRRVFRIVNGGTPTSGPENWDGDVAWATPVDLAKVNGGRIEMTDRTLTRKGLAEGSRLVPSGSLILSTRAPIGYVAECTTPMAFNQGCRGLVPRGEADARYFRYQLSSLTDVLGALGQGSTFVELSGDALAGVEINMPPLVVQGAIADYLDAETARIDALITKKQRMIELLEQRFEASVYALVTRGSRGGHSMRPTRQSWIGDVPEHWGTPTVSMNFDLQLGKMLNAEAADGPDQFPYLRNTNVQWDHFDFGDLATMHFSAADRVRCELRPGDVLVCEGGEVGRASVWTGEVESCYFQKAIHRVRPRSGANGRFLMYCLRAAAKQSVFSVEGNTSTIVHLTGEQLAAHRFPWPPANEQQEIVDALDREARRLATAQSALQRQIGLLLEHRQALITAAVTGELEVPGVAA